MKNRRFFLAVMVTALACVFVPSPIPAANTGNLTVRRSPKIGKKVILDVYLDGKRVGQLQRDRSYISAVPAGAHDVKVQASTQKPMNQATKQVVIQAGKDTTVTASWDGQRLTLQ